MKLRTALHRRRRHVPGLLETAVLLALARRIEHRRGGKLLPVAAAALLVQESKRRRTRGNEAPMVIGPRHVRKLLRHLLTTIRETKR
jgi:hypothetical protein